MLTTWTTKALFLKKEQQNEEMLFHQMDTSLDVSLRRTYAEKPVFETIWLCVLTIQRASPSQIIINQLFKAHWNISLLIPYLTFHTVVKQNTCF